MANGGDVRFNIGFNIDKSPLNQITQSLQQIQNAANKEINLDDEFKKAAEAAKQLESIINSSWNDKLGQLNLDKFNQSIKTSYGGVEELKNSLAGAGTAGQTAFNTLASQVLNTNLQLRESNTLLDEMATTMGNTVKWGITSSIFNNITGAIQKAYYYAKDLDSSLNNIRIVTGDSADQMERFAKTANDAAKELGRSTLDYTDAALKFYQQGLSDEEVEARTQTTLKAQNITGAGSEMVDYLTAVWNGYNINDLAQTEQIVDKLAKVADSSASDMSQLAIAMSKVASTASVMGVDVDQLNAQLATVIATTRQAPESVGTAFKSIYSRLNDIKTGADDAQISLGNYSGKMADLGFNVLDANGSLRDTGQVMEQIGSRWGTLTKEQQVYLAETMGGIRQVNQVMALFENWTTYSNLLNESLGAQGTLNQKNSVYLESTAAHMKQLAAETERTYDILFDQKAVNGFADVFKGALGLFNDFIEGIGGGVNVFINLGAAVANVFNKQIGEAINAQIKNIELLRNNLAQVKSQQEWSRAAMDQAVVAHTGNNDSISQSALEKQAAITQRTLEVRKALTQEQYNQLQNLQQQVGVAQTRIDYLSQYKTILQDIGISEKASVQVVQDNLNAKQQELDLQKLMADYIQLSLIPANQLTQIQKQRIIAAEDILLAESEEAGILVGISDKQQAIINKLQTEVLSDDQIRALLDQQNILIKQQQQHVNKVKQAVEGRKAAQDGTTENLKKEQAARERIISQTQDQAARQLTIQNVVRATTGVVQSLSALLGGIQTATSQTATASEKLNGVWAAGVGSLSGIANIFAPGSGILIQGIGSLIKSGLELLGVWDSWESKFSSVQEDLKKYQQQFNETISKATDAAGQKKNLESLSDEFESLSRKAGQYGQHLANLTEEQQRRYKQIVDQIIESNPQIVLGYNDQGQAIINNNTALEATLKLLDQQYEKQMAIAYGSDKIAEKADTLEKAQQKKDQAYKDRDNPIEGLDLANQEFAANISNILGITSDSFGIFTSTDTMGIYDQLVQWLEERDSDSYQSLIDYKNEYISKLIDAEGNVEEISAASLDLKQKLVKTVTNLQLKGISIDERASGFEREINNFLYDIVYGDLDTAIANIYQDIQVAREKLELAAKDTEEEWTKALDSFKTSITGALAYNPEFNSAYSEIKDSMGDLFTTGFSNTLLEAIDNQVKNFDYDTYFAQGGSIEGLDQAVANFVNGKLKQSFNKIDQESLFTIQEGIEELLNKTVEGEINTTQYREAIQNLYEAFLSQNESFANMLKTNEKNYDIASAILESLFSGFGVEIGPFIEGQLPTITTATDEALDGIENAISVAVTGRSNSETLPTALTDWISSSFNPEQIEQIYKGIQEGSLVLSGDIVSNLSTAQQAVSEFVDGVSKEAANEQEAVNQIVENFENILTAAQKIGNGEGLNSPDRNFLAEALGLTQDQLSQMETDADWAEKIIERVKQNYADAADPNRIKAIQAIYPTLDKLRQAFKNHQISAQDIKNTWGEVYASELKSLGLNENKLREYAEAKGLAFKSDFDKEIALNVYKEAENLDKLSNSIKNNGQAIKNSKAQTNEGWQAAMNLKDAFAELGEEVSLDWIVNNIDAVIAAAEDGIVTLEELQALMNGVGSEGGEEQVSEPTSRDDYLQSKETVSNASSAYSTLEGKGNLSTDQAAALAQLEATHQELASIAEDSGRFSQDYLDKLQEIISSQQVLTEQKRVQARDEAEANLKELEAQQTISEAQYQRALNTVNDSEASDKQISKAYQIIKAYNDQADLRKEIAEEQANIIQLDQADLQTIKDKYSTLQELNEALSNNEISEDQYAALRPEILEQSLQALGKTNEQLEEYADYLLETNEALEGSKQAAQDFAITQWEIDETIESLKSNFSNYREAIQEARDSADKLSDPAYSDAMRDLRDAMDQILGIDLPDSFLESADALDLMQGYLVDGTVSLEQLRQAALESILVDIQLPEGDIQGIEDEIISLIQNDWDKIVVGAQLDDTEFAAGLKKMLDDGSLTTDQVNEILSKIGYQTDFTTTPVTKMVRMPVAEWDSQTSGEGTDTVSLRQGAHINYMYAPVTLDALNLTSKNGASHGTTRSQVSSPSSSGGSKGGGGSKGKGGGGGSKGGNKSNKDKEAQRKRKEAQKKRKEAQKAAEKKRKQQQKAAEKARKQEEKKQKEAQKAQQKRLKEQQKERQKAEKQAQKATAAASKTASKQQKKTVQKTIKDLEKQIEKEPEKIEFLDEQIDRYHNINLQLEKLSRNLDRIQKQESKLFGRDLINNLNEQLKILRDQQAAYEIKIDLAQREKEELADALKSQGVGFDANTGDIENYYSILADKQAQVNSIIAQYNNMTAAEQEAYKETVEQAKEDYKTFASQIQRYEELNNETLPDLIDTIKEARDKEIEIQIQKFKMKVEIEFELSEATKNFNDFKKKIIDQIRDDDILGGVRSSLADFSAYYNKTLSGGVITSLTDQLNDTMEQIRQINSTGFSTVYGDNKTQALEDLKRYTDELMKNLENVEQLIKGVNASYQDMINATSSAFSEQINEYQFIQKLLSHSKKVSELLYGQDSFRQLDNYYKKQRQNDRAELDFQKQQKDFWWAQMQATKARMAVLDEGSNAYKDEQDRFENLKQNWLKSVEDFNSQVEKSIQHLLDEYKNNVSVIFDDLSKKLTKGRSLKGISQEWELINKDADMYLDKINAMSQIQNFQSAVRQAMEDNKNNLAAQRSLNELMEEQLKFLKDKDRLTQYDVDRANALLQIEIKRLALENARQNKSKLRLRRDSQGNYNYQYVADESQMQDNEQSLQQAQMDLYNLDKGQYQSNINDILSLQQSFNDQLAALYAEYPTWSEQAEEKRRVIVERYGNMINQLVDDNNNIRVNLTASATDSLASLYNTDVENFRSMTDEEIDILISNLVPQWNSAAQQMANTIAGQGGLIGVCNQAFDRLSQNTLNYANDLDTLQQIASEDFDRIAQSQDENIVRVESMLEKNNELIQAYQEELNAVKEVILEVNQLANSYMTAKNEAIAATQAAYKFWQQEKNIASQQAIRDAQEKTARQARETQAREREYDEWEARQEADQAHANAIALTSAFEQQASDALRKQQDAQRQANNKAIQDQIAMWKEYSQSLGTEGSSYSSSSFLSSLGLMDEQEAGQDQIDQDEAKKNGKYVYSGDEYDGKVYMQSEGKSEKQSNKDYYIDIIPSKSKSNDGSYIDIDDFIKDKRIMQYATGGYTGSWGNQGKLAVLDEKELVLNQRDTSNLLSAVNVVRAMDELLGSLRVNNGLPSILSQTSGFSNQGGSSLLDQNVHITATFPAVNSRVEIEEAFSNLINRAGQYAFNTMR